MKDTRGGHEAADELGLEPVLAEFAVGGHEVGQGVLLFAEQLDFN